LCCKFLSYEFNLIWVVLTGLTLIKETKNKFRKMQNDEVATAWLNNDAVRKAIHVDKVCTKNYYTMCVLKIKDKCKNKICVQV